MNEKELTRIIKSGELSGVYYLYGTDLYSVEKYKREMVKRTVKAGDETYNLHEFEGKDIDTDGLSEAVDGFPMFADKLCVTVCDLDLEEETKQRPGHRKLDETRMKQLTETVSNVPDTTVLIFYTANINVCGGKKYPTPKNKKLIDLVAKKGTVCEINVKSRSESVRIICAESSKRGSAMDDKAAGLLFDRCCGNMTMIMNELDKLTSYANGKSIDVHTVELLPRQRRCQKLQPGGRSCGRQYEPFHGAFQGAYKRSREHPGVSALRAYRQHERPLQGSPCAGL